MKKILALTLTLVMCLLAFISCADAEEMLEKAEKALLKDPYKMTMSMDFTTDDKDMKEIFDAMSVEVPAVIDGENMSMDMSMELMGEAVEAEMILFDKTLYYDMSVMGETIKMKSKLSDADLKEFTEENGTSMPVDYTQFGEFEIENTKNKTVITCNGLSDGALDEIEDVIKSSTDAMGAKVSVEDVKFSITLKDDKYDSMDFSCTYKVTVDSKTVSVGARIKAKFEYNNVSAVKAPANANEYEEVSFDDIM